MAEKFEAWGLVELMGHQRVAGQLSEQPLGGGNLLRVDIPNRRATPSAWMNAEGLVSSASGGGYDIPLYPGAACDHDLESPNKTLKATLAPDYGWRCTVCKGEWYPAKSGGNAGALVTIGHTQDETGYCLVCESRPCRQA